ncbi:hypothetical protein CHLRE_08g373377v5 [Chlamydomonas reinhardtii]|uniref:Uncharacterized protein n=1 Tax=Chlamydomonas reinhardtii TaxID=3055 RepID=A0A2K3DHH5_CHLRE|nr:uncharacterized protein CHLRE_08g373377v5 [Chlamydomonas reinhardtii]PNW79985.1 hypothetical protein CHLRE_08g373377v5 [Chlamydomonas reinhardtii]
MAGGKALESGGVPNNDQSEPLLAFSLGVGAKSCVKARGARGPVGQLVAEWVLKPLRVGESGRFGERQYSKGWFL